MTLLNRLAPATTKPIAAMPMKRMETRPRKAPGARAILVVALAAAATACSNSSTYTYVNVQVTIDRQTVSATQLYKVTTCEFQVLGAETSNPDDLRCPENRVPYDVGTFQWTSRAPSGSLQFKVTIFDANLVPIGEGTSAPLALAPGKVVATSVLVVAVDAPDPQPQPDAGTDSLPGTDAGAPATPDAASGPGDGGADQAAPLDGNTSDQASDVPPDAASDATVDVASSDAGTTDLASGDLPVTPDAAEGDTEGSDAAASDAASGG